MSIFKHKFFNKLLGYSTATRAQVLVVWLVFALMVALTYYFMSEIEAMHLRKDVDDLLALTQSRLEFEYMEAELSLNNISFSVRRMIFGGEGSEAILDYLTEVSNSILKSEKRIVETSGAFGYFDAFGGKYLNGSGWVPPNGYDPKGRPWYIAAISANGNIANTPVYRDMEMNVPVTTRAQQILDDEGRQLGVIGIAISLDNIARQIFTTNIADGSYGIMFDDNLQLIIHPDQIGKRLQDLKLGPEIIADIEQGAVVSEREVINYKDETVILFTKKLLNNWYIGFVIPKDNYYRSIKKIALILILLGAILAAILSFILLQITEKKQIADEQAQSMMKKNEATAHWYKSILDAVPLPITVTDANTNWTFVNTQVENFLNVKFEDIKGKPCSNWNASICKTPNCGIECAKRGIKQTFFSHNGSSYKVDVEILKDINGETAGYIEVVQDITQLEEISRRQMDAETVSKAKSSFIATMSHEIRTPLNAILGITDIHIQDLKLSQDTRDALIKIHNSGELLLHIINDILDLSKIEAGKLELVEANYDVPGLINEIAHMNMIHISNKPIEFKLNVNENMPMKLFGDERRIRQILNNLLSNAFKYTDQGSVLLSFDIDSSAQKENSDEMPDFVTLILKVSDTGQGITQEEISNMFNEYSHFNLDTNRTTVGAGLGMNITRYLIRLMDGEISVDSEPGKGSVFTVYLTQKCVNSRKIGKALAENLQSFHFGSSPILINANITRESMPYAKVLVVDDVETNLFVAKGLLLAYDLKIDLASSGFEAINKIKKGAVYDIVFMDHMMPKMDGVETVKKIREMGYSQPIVALTANAVVGQADFFLQNGFDDFISKPIDVRQLDIVLNKLIRDKQPPEVIEKARREKAEHGNLALQNSGGHEIEEIFLRDAEKSLSILENIMPNNFNKEDMQNFVIQVHAMKSALANIGENELSEAALQLEQAGREENSRLIKTETPKFLEALRAISEKIKTANAKNETENDDKDSLVFLREKLLSVKEACASLDKKTAKNALNELKKKNWSHNTKKLLNSIAEHLLHSEFENAASLAGNYVKA